MPAQNFWNFEKPLGHPSKSQSQSIKHQCLASILRLASGHQGFLNPLWNYGDLGWSKYPQKSRIFNTNFFKRLEFPIAKNDIFSLYFRKNTHSTVDFNWYPWISLSNSVKISKIESPGSWKSKLASLPKYADNFEFYYHQR